MNCWIQRFANTLGQPTNNGFKSTWVLVQARIWGSSCVRFWKSILVSHLGFYLFCSNLFSIGSSISRRPFSSHTRSTRPVGVEVLGDFGGLYQIGRHRLWDFFATCYSYCSYSLCSCSYSFCSYTVSGINPAPIFHSLFFDLRGIQFPLPLPISILTGDMVSTVALSKESILHHRQFPALACRVCCQY